MIYYTTQVNVCLYVAGNCKLSVYLCMCVVFSRTVLTIELICRNLSVEWCSVELVLYVPIYRSFKNQACWLRI